MAFSTYAQPSRWVVGFNAADSGDATRQAGWAYSADGAGHVWTASVIPYGLAWGNPGTSPCNGTNFLGWRSDPALAAVTDPSLSNSGRRILYTMVANTAGNDASDVVIARSNDGGVSWGVAYYVNDYTSGCGTDTPSMASNFASPYHTFVSWTNLSNTWLNSVQYSLGDVPSRGVQTIVPRPPGGAALHPRVAVGRYTTCGGSIHEAVYVAFVTAGGRCSGTSGTPEIQPNTFWLALYDTASKIWFGPWKLNDDPSWPNCVGQGYLIDNGPLLNVAVDSASATFFTAHTQSSPYGTRAQMDGGTIVCAGGTTQPTFWHWRPQFCTPNASGCNSDGNGYNNGGGSPIIQDEWGVALAFIYKPGTPAVPRTVMTWDTTRDNPSHNNVSATIYMQYSENNWGSASTPQRVGVAYPGSGETVPWDQTLGDWSDYQGLGVSPVTGNLLAAWGGDCRLGPPCYIYSDLFQ